MFLKAKAIRDFGDGYFEVDLGDADSITTEQRDMLQKLYPNLYGRAVDLLDMEALLSCVVPEETKLALYKKLDDCGVVPRPVPKEPGLTRTAPKPKGKLFRKDTDDDDEPEFKDTPR